MKNHDLFNFLDTELIRLFRLPLPQLNDLYTQIHYAGIIREITFLRSVIRADYGDYEFYNYLNYRKVTLKLKKGDSTGKRKPYYYTGQIEVLTHIILELEDYLRGN